MTDLAELAPHLSEVGDKVYGGRLSVSEVTRGAYDHNWAREHELFYSKQAGSVPFVQRLVMQEKDEPAGFVHIRPLSDHLELSETYLAPPKELREDRGCYLTCAHAIRDYGQDEVECVPFITPDTLFSMCAQASAWICIRLLHELSSGYVERLDMPTIQSMSKGHPFADKAGLPFHLLARMLRMCRCQAFYFDSSTLSQDQMEFCLYAYVESRLPVIIGVDVADLPWWPSRSHGYHSIVAIGHTMNDGFVDGYVFHDESTYPYQKLTSAGLRKAWHAPPERKTPRISQAVVAVPPVVAAPVPVAFQAHAETVSFLIASGVLSRTLADSSLRPQLMHVGQLFLECVTRNDLMMGEYASEVVDVLSSSYYWVIRMLSPKRRRERGFFVMDATGQSDLNIVYSELDKVLIVNKDGESRTVRGR